MMVQTCCLMSTYARPRIIFCYTSTLYIHVIRKSFKILLYESTYDVHPQTNPPHPSVAHIADGRAYYSRGGGCLYIYIHTHIAPRLYRERGA